MGENLCNFVSFFIFLENLFGKFCLIFLFDKLSLGDKSKTTDSEMHSRLFFKYYFTQESNLEIVIFSPASSFSKHFDTT